MPQCRPFYLDLSRRAPAEKLCRLDLSRHVPGEKLRRQASLATFANVDRSRRSSLIACMFLFDKVAVGKRYRLATGQYWVRHKTSKTSQIGFDYDLDRS